MDMITKNMDIQCEYDHKDSSDEVDEYGNYVVIYVVDLLWLVLL
jgi:hypothetical protein